MKNTFTQTTQDLGVLTKIAQEMVKSPYHAHNHLAQNDLVRALQSGAKADGSDGAKAVEILSRGRDILTADAPHYDHKDWHASAANLINYVAKADKESVTEALYNYQKDIVDSMAPYLSCPGHNKKLFFERFRAGK